VCLEKNPDNRWQNVRDLKQQLLWIQKGLTEAKARTAKRAGANWLRLGAAAVLGSVLTAGLLWRFASRELPDSRQSV